MKILIINGPNLSKIKLRDKDIYGSLSFDELLNSLKKEFAKDFFEIVFHEFEGEIITSIHNASFNFDGIIINPGGFSHTSVAIRDAMELSKIPIIEVHLSNISGRENFRNVSITASKAKGYISGFKHFSYFAAVYLLKKHNIN
jgi:3-dehydroquinate dehydratase-2